MTNPPLTDDGSRILLLDRFERPVEPGGVIGSHASDDHTRRGVDREGTLSIDGGALRIRPLMEPGFGRAGIAYGPFLPEPGLALAAHVLNGHHASQPYRLKSLLRQVYRWIRGSESDPLLRRLRRWPGRWRRDSEIRRLRTWLHHRTQQPLPVAENFACGWWREAAPTNVLEGGPTLAIRPAGPRNGTMMTRVGGVTLELLHDLQNVPLHLLMAMRPDGIAYYIAGLEGTRGATAYPSMRPLMIAPCVQTRPLYVGLQQSVLGEIGFGVDTRVFGVAVARIAGWRTWFGTACLADRLTGEGPLAATHGEAGGPWHGSGEIRRTAVGAVAAGSAGAQAWQRAPDLPGLVRVVLSARDRARAFALLWRFDDQLNHWRLELGAGGYRVVVREGGALRVHAEGNPVHADSVTLQVVDDGEAVQILLDHQPVFRTPLPDPTHGMARGVGLAFDHGEGAPVVRNFEVHARTIPIPSELELGAAWSAGGGRLVAESFGTVRADLAGDPQQPGRRWRKLMGHGTFSVPAPGEVHIVATPRTPLPDRTAYGVDWAALTFADLSATVRPPGTARGQQQASRAGFIFWQDPDNYLIVNVWLADVFAGASVSAFFYLNGFEDVYDAVWTNVGERITWGRPFELRVIFDGDRFRALVDQELVLYRAISDVYPGFPGLAIRRVGLVGNWEWGRDTGSRFSRFVAREAADSDNQFR